MSATHRPSVAVVGCGYWGKNHVRALDALGARLTLCDTDRKLLTALHEKFPMHRTTRNFSDVLSNPDIQAVVLATPAATHFSLARQALLAGKDVLVEKPLALDYDQAAELVQLADAGQQALMVGHLLRYHTAVVKLKELVQQGVLGRIQYIYSNRLNMGRVRREENALWSFAPHDISIILCLMDAMPVQVCATGGAYLQPDVVDVSLSTLLFENEARCHIFVSWLHPFKEQKLVVVGSRSMAVFDDSQPSDKLALYDKEIDLVNGNFVTRPPVREPVPVDDVEPLMAEDRHFLDCVANRTAPQTNGYEGLRVLSVLQACQESLQRNGEPVSVRRVAAEVIQ